MEICLIIMAFLMPIMTIGGFVVGYNTKAKPSEKILKPKPKHEPSEAESLLERIDRVHI